MERVLPWIPLLSGMLAWFLFLGRRAYASERGKNLATKQDIGEITREVESVRAEFVQKLGAIELGNRLLLEEMQQRHKLSMAAIDKRLATHQEAFARCLKLPELAHDKRDGSTDRRNEMLQWWRDNCLYLEKKAGESFLAAIVATQVHGSLLEARSPALEANWSKIKDAADVVAAAAQLPGFGTLSAERVGPKGP